METVDVLVRIFDRGKAKAVTVPVELECFNPARTCWKTIANIKAAVLLELPFTELERGARYGLRQEDKTRLAEIYGKREEGGGRSGQGN